MAMHEHYKLEDYPDVIEQRDIILKTCLNALKDVEEGVFINKTQYIQDIHGAFQILSALNDKKKYQQKDIYGTYGWRSYF